MNITPELFKLNFKCLHCKIATQHEWRQMSSESIPGRDHRGRVLFGDNLLDDFKISKCLNCGNPTIWYKENYIFPNASHQPSPNLEMPEEIKLIYEEAAAISRLSPRASCALMRYALEELIKSQTGDIGYKGSLYKTIEHLYEESLIDDNIKESLDIIRLTGNDSLHGNKIDMNDQTNADYMFILINEVVESLIAAPKKKKDMLEKFRKG